MSRQFLLCQESVSSTNFINKYSMSSSKKYIKYLNAVMAKSEKRVPPLETAFQEDNSFN